MLSAGFQIFEWMFFGVESTLSQEFLQSSLAKKKDIILGDANPQKLYKVVKDKTIEVITKVLNILTKIFFIAFY